MWVGVKDDRVVAFLSSFPVRLKTPAGQTAVLCPGDLMVASEARGDGLGERIVQAYTSEAGLLPHGLAYSAGGGRTFSRAGYRAVFAQPAYVRPLQAKPVVGESVRRYLPAWLRWLAPILAPAAQGVTLLANAARSPGATRGLTVEVDPEIGDDFDRLWSSAAEEIPFVFVRDAAAVAWRYRDDPLIRHTILAVREASGALLGWAALCQVERGGVQVGKIMDLFCAPSRAADVVRSVMPAIIEQCKLRGVDIIAGKGLFPPIRSELRRYLYLTPPGHELPALLMWVGDAALTDIAYGASNWHLAHGDGDEDFAP